MLTKQHGVYLDINEIKLFCIVCGSRLPMERIIQRASTCARPKDCKARLKKIRRAISDMRQCRLCHRPSTPEERRNFARWRRDSCPVPERIKKSRRSRLHPVQDVPPEPVAPS